MAGLRLIGDIGGTNARFAISENGQFGDVSAVLVSKYATLQAALADYLAQLPRTRRPSSGALAIAGPVSGDAVQLTNLNWSFSTAALKEALDLSSLVVMNDFAATAMAIPYLAEADCYPIGHHRSKTGGPIGVIGPGTGLGMSSLVPSAGAFVLLPGEGGHATLPAGNRREDQILELLRGRWPHVSAERVLSGAGLVNLYEALCTIAGKAPDMLSPTDVTDRAMRKADQQCIDAFEVFCAMLGMVAGNLALTIGATGGIYIAGGILLRFREAFSASSFRDRFENKGRFRDYLREIPTWLILEELPALLGLANLPERQ